MKADDPPGSAGKTRRTCIDCGAMYELRGPRQERCQSCAVEHTRKKNLERQHAFRARHRTPEEAERIQRRTWRVELEKHSCEMLVSEGMSPSAAARKVHLSHHTILKHLATPEAQWRVAILRRTNVPEPELPH